MSAQGETHFFPTYQQVITHLRTPIYRNGYFLMFSSLSTSGIGLIYWILAAHRYSTYMVGINSAIIAAMTFLAGVSELNLMSALMRFIPMAGRSTRRFVLLSYLASLVIAAIISVIFIANLKSWSPALKFLGENPALSLWFILSTMFWCIFVLQDSVLTGLRQASWVPVENTVFSLTKVALMIIFTITIPALGIFASWTFALVVAILPTSYYIFHKLIPAHEKKEEQTNLKIDPKQVIRFAATDYLGALFWIVANTLMPVIVTTVSGATANAYFFLAWTIANTLYLIGPAMGSSLVVETAKDQQKLGFYSLRMYKNTMRIVIPVALLITLGAPYILLIFGRGYSIEGTMVLRLLALSAVPNVINSIYVSVARAQRRVAEEVIVLGILCSLLLGTSYIFLKAFGIVGVGYGWLGSQFLVACFVYGLRLRKLWKDPTSPSFQHRLTIFSARFTRFLNLKLYRLAVQLSLIPFLVSARELVFIRSKRSKVASMLPQILEELPALLYESNNAHWRLDKLANNQTNTIVAFLRSSNQSGSLVVKIPGNAREAGSLQKQYLNLTSLVEYEALGDWRQILPTIMACGTLNGCEYYVERGMQGVPMGNLFREHHLSWNLVRNATEAINHLHRATARSVVVSRDQIQSWVDEPVQNLQQLGSAGYIPSHYLPVIDFLKDRLHTALLNRTLSISWIHGDYSPANILVEPDTEKITGIVDWDLAKPDELPLLDLLHLLISIRMEIRQREMGFVLSELLIKRDWRPAELMLIEAVAQDLGSSAVELEDMLLLTWLRHINANMAKTSRYDHHQRWVAGNFIPVLQVLEEKKGTSPISDGTIDE